MRFPKSSDPRQLNIKEVWSLYRTLRPGIEQTKDGYLIDDIITLMGHVDESEFKTSLRVMFRPVVNWLQKTPVDVALAFTQGLKKAQIFEFHEFVKRVTSHGNPR